MNRLTLYNMAIAHVGGSRIQSTEHESNAEICNSFINIVIDNALESHDFTFARRYAKLAQNIETVGIDEEYVTQPKSIGDFEYSYNIPSDLVQMRGVIDHSTGEWKIYGKELGSNQEEVSIDYTFAVRTITLFPSLFAEALSFYLAYYITSEIAGDNEEKRARLYQQYEFFLKKAIGADSGKEYISTPGEAEFTE